MPSDPITLTRKELYERVWSEPMSNLAPTFGLSDVGLAKVCRKYGIPTPPVGHWAKIAHGKTSPQPKLSELSDEDLQEIQFFRDQFEKDTTGSSQAPVIEVNEQLVRPHRLVDQTRRKLRAAKAGHRGELSANGERCLNIAVTRKSLTRALCILDALVKHWESVGGTVSAGEPATTFSRGDDSVSIALTEQFLRHKIPTKYEYPKDYKYEATGNLTISIDLWGDGLRKTWSDGKVQRLEDVLGKVALGLEAWMVHLRKRRLDKECLERQKRRAEQARRSWEDSSKEEAVRREHLEACAGNWARSQKIRSYLSALDTAIETVTVGVKAEQYPEWREWAEWYAAELCPLTPSMALPAILGIKPPTNTPIADLDLTSESRSLLERAEIGDTNELASLSKKELADRCQADVWKLYREATVVLEGLGYDVSERNQGYHW